jgi:hypothetical protein
VIFSSVRVHTDVTAAASSRDVGAAAYTVGNHVVFGKGTYAPGTEAGNRLLAHELTHVVQQRKTNSPPAMAAWRISDVGDPAEAEAEQAAESAAAGRNADVTGISHPACSTVIRSPLPLSHDMVIQRQKAGEPVPAPGEKSVDPSREESEALAAVAAVVTNWTALASASRPYPALKPWIAYGDAVVELIRSHTSSGLAAVRAHDHELAAAYTSAAQADKITYDYIAWHVTAYVNLLSLKPTIESLVNSFDHDDRAFTGRANAERITRQLQTAIKGLDAHSKEELSIIRTDIPLEVRAHTPRAVSITVTSPAVGAQAAALFRTRTAAMQSFQANIQQGADFVAQFLDQAFLEGLEQAEEAIEEYYKVKEIISGIKGGKKKGPEKERQKEPERTVEPHPILDPVPIPEDDKKAPASMRFQVQWNSRAKDKARKGQFSEVASALASVGVTVQQAVGALLRTHAKVTPARAKKNAEPAVAAQTKWIEGRPAQGGISVGNWSRSEYFEYDYPDARVDVENLRGHNLRQ